jgi:hypothetical protein
MEPAHKGGRVDARNEGAGSVCSPDGASGLACAEVKGGTQPVHDVIELPGLQGVLYSMPCEATRGGDVHYLSVCGSGLLSRVCVADVAGHGGAVAAVSHETYDQLRRSVDIVDDRRVFRALDQRLNRIGEPTLTTAVLATYFPPSRRLSISYAGHPEAWLYKRAERTWMPIEAEPAAPKAAAPVGLPLGTGLSPAFTRRRIKVEAGDRVLLLTDGVLEATSPDGVEFGQDRLEQVLRAHAGGCGELVDELLAALRAHTGRERLVHDDVTIMAAEVVAGPRGPAIWHVIKNRLRPGRVQVAAIRRRQDPAAGLMTP